ncbi:MAG: N-6 DNA methylase [Candidatus Poribacteria bacterium]|nr:N-6 DNA methylase [Candidatus Poribacteria bacterium]
MKNNQTDFLHIGEQKGYIERLNEGTTIHYIAPDKKYKFTDPEEKVRARFYVELIEHFQYSQDRIDLEVRVPRRTPSDLADIVVFQDDEKKTPFIVVECKKDEISEAEFEQAIEQAFGNCNSLRGHYAVVVAGNTRRSFDVKGYKPRERTENIIADPPIGYGKVQEWRYLKGVPHSEPTVIERGELIRVLEKCHDTLWQGGKFAPTQAFDELAKILFIKIRDEKKARRDGEPYDFQIKTHEAPESVANRINALYQEAKTQDPEVFTEDIEVDENRLFSVVSHLQGISLNQTDLDVKGIAFERFLGNFFKGEIGQFFTPREVVEFMVDMVTPHHEELVLDPACGSGGFLLHAMDYIRKQASDYYAEESREHYIHWHDFAEKRLFGIEVNDSIARVAKMNMIIHDDGHSNVISNDALVGFDTLYNQHSSFEKDTFDVILTNPPFGATIKQAELPYLESYELGRGNASQKTEILFLERCFDFLKWKTGKLAIILPDGILTNSSLQYVRDYIERHFQILAVVSLPQIAFSHYGAGVKTSILFLRKFSEQEYAHYQAAINQITKKNATIYGPQIEALEDERKTLSAKGSPAQIDVTETYRQQFIAILDGIEALNQKLGKTATKKVQTLSTFFFPKIESTPTTEFELFDPKTARAELKAQTSKLNALEKKYKAAFKAGAEPDWESQVKAEYKEKIDAVKEEWEEKNTEDIREWIQENANHPIFMAIAERIGYDATGRKDDVNDLDIICEEYRKFTENPDFFA